MAALFQPDLGRMRGDSSIRTSEIVECSRERLHLPLGIHQIEILSRMKITNKSLFNLEIK